MIITRISLNSLSRHWMPLHPSSICTVRAARCLTMNNYKRRLISQYAHEAQLTICQIEICFLKMYLNFTWNLNNYPVAKYRSSKSLNFLAIKKDSETFQNDDFTENFVIYARTCTYLTFLPRWWEIWPIGSISCCFEKNIQIIRQSEMCAPQLISPLRI